MPLTNAIRRSGDTTHEGVLACREFPLRENLAQSSNGCRLSRKPLAGAMRLASRAFAPDALPCGYRIFAFEPIS
jgi:hypothetical protein